VDHHLIEAQPHIKDDDLLAAADGGHIPPDLFVSAHCDDFYIHVLSPVLLLVDLVVMV
jgi:hypothetical protein